MIAEFSGRSIFKSLLKVIGVMGGESHKHWGTLEHDVRETLLTVIFTKQPMHYSLTDRKNWDTKGNGQAEDNNIWELCQGGGLTHCFTKCFLFLSLGWLDGFSLNMYLPHIAVKLPDNSYTLISMYFSATWNLLQML